MKEGKAEECITGNGDLRVKRARIFSELLKKNSTLTELNLARNCGMRHIKNRVLRYTFPVNAFDNRGLLEFCDVLKTNTILTKLSLKSSFIIVKQEG